jgi:hypothetical protein
MKFIKIYILLAVVVLTSCNNIKNKAILASNLMINDILNNNEKIEEYFYNPIEDIIYVWLNIYDKNEIGNYKQYGGKDDFLKNYIEAKNQYGKLIDYEIININYKFELLPFYDYGRHNNVDIILKCYYENKITEENISGIYSKENNKIYIVSYWIKYDEI